VSTDPYRLRTLDQAADVTTVFDVLSDAFGEDISPEELERDRLVFEVTRDHVIEHRDDGIVANAGAYTRVVTVPGSTVAGAGDGAGQHRRRRTRHPGGRPADAPPPRPADPPDAPPAR
jgi:hypothetical protein